MKSYDVIVIGAGSGLDIVSFADDQGLKVALVEEGPLGGTCHNRGCIPSKMLIHSADLAETIRKSKKFGFKTKIEEIDFPSITKRVFEQLDKEATEMEKAINESENATFYKGRGKFVGPKILEVGKEKITADKIFIVGGTRAFIPKINGLDKINYLTSTEAMRLQQQPKKLIIIGGGYIAAELGHFFGALGTEVTFLVRGNKLLDNEDEEVADWFKKEFNKKYNILFGTEAEQIINRGNGIAVKTRNKNEELKADRVLLATGRRPNSDIMNLSEVGFQLNSRGYLKVNEFLETSIRGVWALGDILGVLPFKHTANHQVGYAIRNAFFGKKEKVDYQAIAHAVFSSPQVAGVGKTEEQLKKENIEYQVGRAKLSETAQGDALLEDGLVKVLVDPKTKEIFGAHIVGPEASVLIHEIVVAMKTTGKISAITDSVHVHPALPEVVRNAFYSVEY